MPPPICSEMPARGACGECRKWQLGSDCCRGGFLRRSTRLRRRADDADHISALPNDLLLQILAGLDCARAAATTSLLSRRWRGLWTRSPRLTFHVITPDQLHAALGRIARPAGYLSIFIPSHHRLSPDRISSLLGAVAPLAPAELFVDIHADMTGYSDADAVDLPCFDRTASLSLHFRPRLRLPPVGDFTALENLSFGSCHMALGDLLPRCPCLRKLKLSCWENDSIIVHSPSLQVLHVSATEVRPRRVDIVAPMLKKLTFIAIQVISDEFSLSLSAPLVDDLSWDCRSFSTFGGIWRMWNLHLKTPVVHTQLTNSSEDTCLQPHHRAHGNILLLHIGAGTINLGNMALTFEQEISQNRVRNVSVLGLQIVSRGHVYGGMVLDLLRLCTSMQKLKVDLHQYMEREACPVNCNCDQPNNWKDQIISLTDLKEVKINGFNGEGHEVGLLKALLRCAALLERVTMKLSRNVSRSCSTYLELPNILKAHPSVKFTIYRWCGDQVLFG